MIVAGFRAAAGTSSRPCGRQRGGGARTIERAIPDEWTPGQVLATRTLLQQVLRTGSPVIACIRRDATPDQVRDIYLRVENLIQDAGLAA